MARFTPHGELSAQLLGNVLYFESSGPFNKEVVDAVVRAHRPLLQQAAKAGPYGQISIFHRSMAATPDALQTLADLLAEWKQLGIAPIANAYVAEATVEGRDIMMSVFARAFQAFGPFRGFHRLDDAEDWIRAALREAGVDDTSGE